METIGALPRPLVPFPASLSSAKESLFSRWLFIYWNFYFHSSIQGPTLDFHRFFLLQRTIIRFYLKSKSIE